MNDLTAGQFFVKWIMKRAWLICLLLIIFNIWFKSIFNLVIVFFLLGDFYNSWLNHKDRLQNHLFFNPPFQPEKKGVYWWGFFFEGLVLLVGLHFLYKGFTTVTGVTEGWFEWAPEGTVAQIVSSISFMIAVAVVGVMMLLLYKISNTAKNRTLIIIYIIVDVVLLMPFNFMFAYECNQKENLNQYYAEAIPPIYEQLQSRVDVQMKSSGTALAHVNRKNERIDNEIKKLEDKIESIRQQRDAIRTQTTDQSKSEELWGLLKDERAAEKAIRNRASQRDTSVRTAVLHEQDSLNRAGLDAIRPIYLGILNDTIAKKHMADRLAKAKKILKTIYEADPQLQSDTALSRWMDQLKVIKETPMEGFFAMMQQCFQWALKEEYWGKVAGAQPTNLTDAQQHWNEQLPRKRLFCFLFALAIDIVPLIIALSFLLYAKQLKK